MSPDNREVLDSDHPSQWGSVKALVLWIFPDVFALDKVAFSDDSRTQILSTELWL